MKYLSYLVPLILISSCGVSPVRKDMDDLSYRTSGVEQFFLPELPNWANFSPVGSCFKSSSIHYLDFSKLKEAYQLEYPQMVELQAQYNEKLEDYFRSTAVKFLKPMEESVFFSNSLEQVKGGIKSLKLPQVPEVEIIWLEGLGTQELKRMAKSGRFDEKLPLLFSSCHSKQSLTQFIVQENLDEVGFYLLSAEWLSPYSSSASASPVLSLNVGELLGKNIKYSFISSKNKQTPELVLP